MSLNKAAIVSLTAVLALAACNDEEEDDKTKNTITTVPEATQDDGTIKISAWDMKYVISDNLYVELPKGRIFELQAAAFCPSLSGQFSTHDEYAAECRNITEAKAQYIIDVYACRGHGDTFYAAMPTRTLSAELPFTTKETTADINPDVLFTVDGMRRQFERYGNDTFTVSRAERIGTADTPRSYEDAMTSYIENGIGRHQEQTPICSAQFKFNLE